MQDFLRTGAFGSINLGISRDDLWSHLGEPENWSLGPGKRSAASRAAIWKYVDVEFHFSEDRLLLVFADHVERLDGGRAINVGLWILNGEVPGRVKG